MKNLKIDQLQSLIRNKKWEQALLMASKFPILRDQKLDIERGAAALKNPKFYLSINQDPQKLISLGISAVIQRFIFQVYK